MGSGGSVGSQSNGLLANLMGGGINASAGGSAFQLGVMGDANSPGFSGVG